MCYCTNILLDLICLYTLILILQWTGVMCVLPQQIYNEMIRDLLNPSSGFLELREDSKGVVVAGISEVQAKKTSEVNIDCSLILVNLRFHVQGLIFLKFEFYGELEIFI